MCFSASASFITGGALSAAGVVTLSESKRKGEKLFAAFPLLFGIQQIIEGFVWISFATPALNAVSVYAYSLFSHVLWPVVTPIAVLLIEKDEARRRILRGIAFVGFVVGSYLFYSISTESVTAQIVEDSIAYRSDHLYPVMILLLYLTATCGSCLVSSHKTVRVFGAVLLGSFAIALWLFFATFFSVWCFFAAILSAIVHWHFKRFPV